MEHSRAFRAESRSRVDARRMLGSRELHPTADQPRQLGEWLRAEHDSGGLDAVIAVPAVLEVNPGSDLIASRGGSLALLRRLEPRAGALRSRSLGRRDSWPTAVRRPTAPQWPASPVSSGPWPPSCAGPASPPTLSAPAPPPPRSSMRARACTASSPRRGSVHSSRSRLIRPDEIAGATAWLANSAADALTGARVPVDGGLCL
jgi:hypothetical protein